MTGAPKPPAAAAAAASANASGIRAARVRVSASTTNLGGGFDCVGMAVARWLSATVAASGGDVEGASATPVVGITRAGTLSALGARGALDDLIYQGFAAACRARNRPLPARLDFAATSEIPVARGLGSSAAAVVAGAALADAALALALSDDELATLCARVEHHPDNVAAAVFGGAVLAVPRTGGAPAAAAPAAAAGPPDPAPDGYLFAPIVPHPSLAFAFVVPDFELSTAAARRALPATLPHATAVAAAAKGAALVQGLATGRADLLAAAFDDVLHVPYRRQMVQGYDAVTAAARGAGAIGATLSGSGPTLVAVALGTDAARRVGDAMRAAWKAIGVAADVIVADRSAAVAAAAEGVRAEVVGSAAPPPPAPA